MLATTSTTVTTASATSLGLKEKTSDRQNWLHG